MSDSPEKAEEIKEVTTSPVDEKAVENAPVEVVEDKSVEEPTETKEEPTETPTEDNSKEDEQAKIEEDIFITEDDTFDVKIKWYKDDNKIIVEGENIEFEEDHENINEFTVTFKYPSQGDYEVIMSSATYRSPEEINVSDIVQMEITRMVTLVRGWSLKSKLERMVELDPFIIKAMLRKLRDNIGMKAIL